jgi:hypothetical protein
MATLWEQDWILERRRPGHALLAGGALVASFALHLLLLETAPALRWNPAPSDLSAPDRRPNLRLREVRRDPPPRAPDAPRPYDPARPDGPLGATPAPREFLSAMDPVLLHPPAPAVPLAGGAEALAPPAPPPRAEWTPRQERIEIAERMARAELEDRPRRILPAVPRVAAAPDIAPPELTPARPAATAGAPSEIWSAAGDPLLARLSDRGGPSGAYQPSERDGDEERIGVPIRLDETAGLFDERPADITPAAPVEQLLRLEVTAWVPPDEPDWRYFALRIHRAGPKALPVLPKDVLFVMDCSQSMTAPRVRAGREGIRNAVARLNPGDRFEVMSFEERVLRCFNEWTPFDAIQAGRANFFIERMESAGQTDLFRSLEEIARIPTDPARPAVAILVSDGRPTVGLMDYFEIIERFSSEQAGRWSMFSFGSGTRANRFLLDFLSYANRGDSLIVRDTAGMPEGIERFAAEIGRPVLMDLGHRFSGVDDREIYPRQLTHLYLDRALVLYGRAPAATSTAGVRIVGRSGGTLHDMVFRLDWRLARAGDADLRTDWRWQKLNALVAEHIRTRDPAVRDEAVGIARKLGRDMPYAADLGVADAPVRSN